MSNSEQTLQTKTFKPEPVEIVWLGYMTKDSSRNSGRTPADVPPPSALNLQQRIPQYGRHGERRTERNPSFSIGSSGMARSSKATLALLIYGIMMHYSAFCTPIGMTFPKMRLENDVFDEDGNSLSDLAFGTDQIAIRSPPSLSDDLYTLYYPPEKSGGSSEEDESEPLTKRHSDGIFTDIYSRYRKQMAVKKYLAAVLGRRYRQRVKNKGRRFAYL